MPQHSVEDMPCAPPPAFPGPALAPSRRAPLGPPPSPTPLHPTTHCPPDSCGQPLCEPQATKWGAPGIRYVPAAPEGTVCGWWAFAPKCLQALATPRTLLLVLCAASFLQGLTVNGLVNTVLTSLERRFDLHSYQSGLVASSYDIAACLGLVFVSYFGGRGHRPRWLGWGVLLMGAGSLLFALPHFAAGRHQVDTSPDTGTCWGNRSAVCADRAPGLASFWLVFMLGQFLHGLGATPLYTLGVTYLDENVKSSHAPVYIGIFYTAAILGPAAGYLLGGALLNIYTELGRRTELTPDSPQWVGAWWVGFLGAGAAAFLIAIPILGYPRQLPGSQRYVVMRASDAHQWTDSGYKAASSPDFGKTIRDLPLSIWLLLKNPPFVLLCLAGATEATLIASMSTFGPKFLESQFSLSASEAATLFGYLVVPAGGGGTLLGGVLVNRLKLRGQGVLKFCLLCTLVSLLAFLVFAAHCPDVPMAGVTVPYNRRGRLVTGYRLASWLHVRPRRLETARSFSSEKPVEGRQGPRAEGSAPAQGRRSSRQLRGMPAGSGRCSGGLLTLNFHVNVSPVCKLGLSGEVGAREAGAFHGLVMHHGGGKEPTKGDAKHRVQVLQTQPVPRVLCTHVGVGGMGSGPSG
ncbi:solute carrier organic anion transporter family member 4A1 isoform X2 [Tamandua tetradactyla]|uniref:solute carrier organic anion transporter family member 4A1 isoform X2 n=1 Tax=Tamandua tetradactyla TaxID=48850 RepID=UPI004053B6F9